MVDIVAIHGIAMNRSSRAAVTAKWSSEIRTGLDNVRSRYATAVGVECAFYGHMYNDGKAVDEAEYGASDVDSDFESGLLVAIADATAPSPETFDGKLYLPGALQRALAIIERVKLFEGLDAVAISFVKQVNRYLSDSTFQERVHDEVSAAMACEPRIVIGHSLGSIVAYNWLHEHPASRPVHLITIGSPLGLRLISSRLRTVGWPGNVRLWHNIAAPHDGVATVKELAPIYSPEIRDLLCGSARLSAHSSASYLSNVQTATVIDGSLR
ncbi:hypothetical protein ACFQWH_10535 [Mycolicibacterium sp. GCM10028919]|uniref:hypothetical protein n=1 Tax=Mycolicibacterium sp. GCM10028919 TaxID=3273401 RepID=UPI00360B5107